MGRTMGVGVAGSFRNYITVTGIIQILLGNKIL